MPRKEGYHSKREVNAKKSSNPRDPANRPKSNSGVGFTYNDIKEAMKPVGEWVDNGVDLWTGQQSYSDFTSRYNELTDGWYSTIAGGTPLLSNLHNALLGRDSAKDYLKNNGLSWKDMQGYNDMKLLGRSASGVGQLANQSGSYLSNIGNDLGKLYSGQRPARITFDKQQYHSNYMDAW